MALGTTIPSLAFLASLSTAQMPSSNPTSVSSVTPAAPSPYCDTCHAIPKRIVNGSLSPYCSRTCASSAGALQSSKQIGAALCSVCGVKPKYSSGNTKYDFCGKTCASKSGQLGNVRKPFVTGANHQCATPGCSQPAYRDASKAIQSKFCGKTHKKLAAESCIICLSNSPKMGVFCSWACTRAAEQKAPGIIEISEGHEKFKSVVDQFKSSWRSGTCPPVQKVYKVITTAVAFKGYETYRNFIEAKGRFQSLGRPEGNQNRRWHGTKRECTLGDPGNTSLCSSASCPLCNIIKTSFSMKFCSRGSYGAGIYTSSTSSKSDGYSSNGASSKYKAMLLNKVIVGRGYKLSSGNSSLTTPPSGYDSILVEIGAGQDELVVFSDDAIRPYYLVVYEP